MTTITKQLAVDGPNDYDGCERQLGTNLGCWAYEEFGVGTHTFTSVGPQIICVMKGVGYLDGQQVSPGTVIEAGDGQLLRFLVDETLGLRHSYQQSMELRASLDLLVTLYAHRASAATGRWQACELESLSEVAEDWVFFWTQAGCLRDRLFGLDGSEAKVLDLSVPSLQCYTFHGLSPRSKTAAMARRAVQMASELSDVRSEEVFRRHQGGWQRWVPGDDGDQLVVDSREASMANADSLVDAVLSTLWREPPSLCRWMCTVPASDEYSVGFLVMPGRTVSDALRQKWGIRAVCSHTSSPLRMSELVVTITDDEVEWLVNGAHEMAKWSYTFDEHSSEAKYELTEVYD